MLARTPTTLVYLSAEELQITERERAGLIEVRYDLASGRVKHEPTTARTPIYMDRSFDSTASHFCMSDWANEYESCGTVHCIGGFMQARGAFARRYSYSCSLQKLFYPDLKGSWSRLTPLQAVRAIDAFLSGAGPDCWLMALADIPL